MIIVLLVLLGLVLGSFVNALVWRLHEQAKKTKKQDLSILNGRSMCVHCRHQLAAKDLVPLFSWLYLRGKCRYCSKPISAQYPLVELAAAVSFALSYAVWPYDLSSGLDIAQFGVWLGLMTGFLALTVYDLRWMLLPDRIIGPLTGLAAVYVAVASANQGANALVGSIVGAVVIFGAFYLLFQLSAGKWIGGGDVKLGVLLGLLAGGFVESLLLIFIASLLGSIYGLATMIAFGKKLSAKNRIPFGPFLLAAAVIVVFCGRQLIDWYTNLLT